MHKFFNTVSAKFELEEARLYLTKSVLEYLDIFR